MHGTAQSEGRVTSETDRETDRYRKDRGTKKEIRIEYNKSEPEENVDAPGHAAHFFCHHCTTHYIIYAVYSFFISFFYIFTVCILYI